MNGNTNKINLGVKFHINEIIDCDDNPFDRQERIPWWSQDKLRNARVMVVGAGAIGNETLKNLALIGISNVFVADFDTISTSNLSRTVLFRKSDRGMKKAEIAAKRFKELSLYDDAIAEWFDGDVVWELGTGVFRRMDIVLGCLDNIETRFAVNKQCWLVGTPWIDAGIYQLAGHVSIFVPPELPCYQCNATEEQLKAARRRYSCDDFKRSMYEEGKVSTVQISSAIVSALQVQEAVKFLCGQSVARGKKIFYQGMYNGFDVFDLPVNHECEGHPSYPEIIELSVSSKITLRGFLELVSHVEYSGLGATLDLRGDRYLVERVKCKKCGQWIDLYRPSFRIYDHETICSNCSNNISKEDEIAKEIVADKIVTYLFNLESTDKKLLDMKLVEIGIPDRHILGVMDSKFEYKYYEI